MSSKSSPLVKQAVNSFSTKTLKRKQNRTRSITRWVIPLDWYKKGRECDGVWSSLLYDIVIVKYLTSRTGLRTSKSRKDILSLQNKKCDDMSPAGIKISSRKSYFATINFVLTTMTLNLAINLLPGFSNFRCHWRLTGFF